MPNYQLVAELRQDTGTKVSKRLRNKLAVPAVSYGPNKESVLLTVDSREVDKALKAKGNLLDLNINGTKKTVIVKELQMDNLKGQLLHVDFYEVSLDKAVETSVPVRVLNEENREVDGGVLNLIYREVNISCLPNDIPEYVGVDVAGLSVGDVAHVSDLEVPAGVKLLIDEDEVVLSIAHPRTETEPEEEDDLGITEEEGETPSEE